MPTYQYRCTDEACRHEFERDQRITDDTRPVCPRCGKPTERVIGKTYFVLVGDRWAKDGYGGKRG